MLASLERGVRFPGAEVSTPKTYFRGLSANTFLLALSSLFGDVSTEMLYPVLPIFLTQSLGASVAVVGVIDGIAQAVQYVAQGVSGWSSDRLNRRKPIALAGYALAAFSKPLIGLSTAWTGVLAARALDRVGAGTRSAPRDALIAASADEAQRGRAFGLEGLGDNLGAFVGPLLTIALLGLFHLGLRSIFLLAFIPGALATLMVVFVSDKGAAAPAGAKRELGFRRFPRRYWQYLGVTAIFGLGSSSNSFLILRTKGLGASLSTTIFIYALFNLVAALASYPAGTLSDTRGRKSLLLLSFLVLVAVYATFAFATNVVVIGVLFVFYGVFQGIFRSVGKAFAADFVPPELRASGIGSYTATIGLTGLCANIVGGQLWTKFGPPATFLFGAGSALVGSVALMLFASPKPRPSA